MTVKTHHQEKQQSAESTQTGLKENGDKEVC